MEEDHDKWFTQLRQWVEIYREDEYNAFQVSPGQSHSLLVEFLKERDAFELFLQQLSSWLRLNDMKDTMHKMPNVGKMLSLACKLPFVVCSNEISRHLVDCILHLSNLLSNRNSDRGHARAKNWAINDLSSSSDLAQDYDHLTNMCAVKSMAGVTSFLMEEFGVSHEECMKEHLQCVTKDLLTYIETMSSNDDFGYLIHSEAKYSMYQYPELIDTLIDTAQLLDNQIDTYRTIVECLAHVYSYQKLALQPNVQTEKYARKDFDRGVKRKQISDHNIDAQKFLKPSSDNIANDPDTKTSETSLNLSRHFTTQDKLETFLLSNDGLFTKLDLDVLCMLFNADFIFFERYTLLLIENCLQRYPYLSRQYVLCIVNDFKMTDLVQRDMKFWYGFSEILKNTVILFADQPVLAILYDVVSNRDSDVRSDHHDWTIEISSHLQHLNTHATQPLGNEPELLHNWFVTGVQNFHHIRTVLTSLFSNPCPDINFSIELLLWFIYPINFGKAEESKVTLQWYTKSLSHLVCKKHLQQSDIQPIFSNLKRKLVDTVHDVLMVIHVAFVFNCTGVGSFAGEMLAMVTNEVEDPESKKRLIFWTLTLIDLWLLFGTKKKLTRPAKTNLKEFLEQHVLDEKNKGTFSDLLSLLDLRMNESDNAKCSK